MSKKTYQRQFGGRTLRVEIGEMAKQARGSALISYGDSQVLSVATAKTESANAGFFPLMVIYQEKLYAAGKIPGGFLRREGRPSEHETLTSRLIDRPLRPLFPEGYMLHYNFPPYSVGETGRYGGVGRREIGHGALGERALLQVLPSEEEFPYSIRVVSEILESNGSSSQATICAGSMALMAAGVPLKAPVAGIAMGLIKEGDYYTILTDIQGMEDHEGDMDFKVAGSKNGITALQMDIKITGINEAILHEALEQAKVARLEILDHMNQTISEVREDLSPFAPKVKMITISPDRIRDVIGAGGKIISQIIEDHDQIKIDIEQDGRVFLMHHDRQTIEKAAAYILNLVREAEVGKIYEGVVKRIEAFGCFVELWPGTEGLVHISKLANERVEKVESVVSLGDQIMVKCIKIDDKGRIDLSRKDALSDLNPKN